MHRTLLVHVYGWLLLLPAAVLLIAFTHYPAVASLAQSFYSPASALYPSQFVGLDNYATMAADPVFWKVLRNNVWFAVGTVPAPTILPMIAVANIWLFFYSPGIGLIDQVLDVFGIPGHNWLGRPDTVMGCLVVMTIWKESGFFMIFYLAGLQAISPELEEAAVLEGAGRWHYFRRVVFPLLMPTTLFVLINAVINSFKLVDQLFIMTKGGPDNASSLLLYYIYQVAFSFLDESYAATLTVVLLSILAVLAIGQYFLLEKRIHYQ